MLVRVSRVLFFSILVRRVRCARVCSVLTIRITYNVFFLVIVVLMLLLTTNNLLLLFCTFFFFFPFGFSSQSFSNLCACALGFAEPQGKLPVWGKLEKDKWLEWLRNWKSAKEKKRGTYCCVGLPPLNLTLAASESINVFYLCACMCVFVSSKSATPLNQS